MVDSLPPGDYNGVNNVFFSSTIFGEDFGDAVAVTTEWDAPGSAQVRREADVILNAGLSWNSYRGSLRRSGSSTVYDVRRVLLHEFGHVLGLDHPDEAGQSVNAIMNSRVSNVDGLLSDDIRGGQSLYGAAPGPSVGPPATIDRPLGRTTSTNGSTFFFVGTADPYVVQKAYLTNSRLGAAKLFKVKGTSRWSAYLRLKPGRNVVRLYIVDFDGARRQVLQRVILKR